MASRSFNKALRAASRQKLPSTSIQRRSFVSALAIRPTATVLARPALAAQQTRGVKTIDFAGHKETVYGVFESFNAQMP